MNRMIAVCENISCGAIFATMSPVSGNNVTIEMYGNKVGPCPRCGSMGTYLDGIYELKDSLLLFVKGPKESIEVLSKVKALLENHQKRSEPATKQEIINEIEKISPRVAEAVKKALPSSSIRNWLAVVISFISLLITIQHYYLNPKDKIDDNKISEKFIQHLLDDNKKLMDKNLKIDSLNADTLINMKVGRNDPCPCKSGLKYKKCCGNPNKNQQLLQTKIKAVSATSSDHSVEDN